MIMYSYTKSFDMFASSAAIPPFAKNIIFIMFLIGFGTKAGVIPVHIWLPRAHPAAPSNVSALMSGIMIKTAIYGILRFVFSYGYTKYMVGSNNPGDWYCLCGSRRRICFCGEKYKKTSCLQQHRKHRNHIHRSW